MKKVYKTFWEAEVKYESFYFQGPFHIFGCKDYSLHFSAWATQSDNLRISWCVVVRGADDALPVGNSSIYTLKLVQLVATSLLPNRLGTSFYQSLHKPL